MRKATKNLKAILSIILALCLLSTTALSVAALDNDNTDEGPAKEPWTIELFNDPILKDADGNPYDQGNPWWYADPEIHRFNGKFWIYPTRSSAYESQLNMDCFSSDDLITWEKHEAILDTASFPDSWRSYWAPAVEEKDGYYYILFGTNDLNLGSASGERNDGDVSGMYLLRADNPAGPFKQFMGKNVPIIPDNYYGAQAIDADMFLDDDNTMYLVYGGWNQCLMAQFKDDMTGFVPLGEKNWKDPDREVNHFWDYFIQLTNYSNESAKPGELNYNATFNGTNETYCEGPIIYKFDDFYYLLYSVGGWTTDTYGLRYAVSKSPLGPYTTIPGRILQTRYSIGSRGAGHHSMVYIEEDDMWLACYHRRPIGGGTNDRYVAIDYIDMYDGELTFIGDSEPTPVKLFEPILATKYWSSESPLPDNLARFVQVGEGPVFSASNSGSSQPVGRAFDTGVNTASYWQSSSTSAGNWLQVDFGKPTTYNEIEVYFNQLGSSTSSISSSTVVQLQKSDNGTDWTDLIVTDDVPGRTLNDAERTRRDGSYYFFREALAEAQTSRYLRLYFPGAQRVGVHEFEVYNITSSKQLVALENAGAKIEEVNPGTISPVVMANLAAGEKTINELVANSAALAAAAEPVAAQPAATEVTPLGNATTFGLIDEDISPMTVVPGSGMEGSIDPYVVSDDGYYYYVRAENETSITVSKTTRLEDIGKAKKVTVWAPSFDQFTILRSPELHKINGKWYLYVSASDGNDHKENPNVPANRWDDNYDFSIYVLEGDDPQGPFTMKGQISEENKWAADGTVLQDPVSEKNYFVWSGRNVADPSDPNAPAQLVAASTSAAEVLDQGVPGMFDNNTNTKMYCDAAYISGNKQAPNGGLNIDLEYSKPITINQFRIATANDSNGRDPREWSLLGSNDGEAWETIYTTGSLSSGSLLPTTRYASTYFPRDDDEPFEVTYKYFRLNVKNVRSSGNGFQISEFNLITPDGEMPLLPGPAKAEQCLFISEMANPWTLTGTSSIISTPEYDWEKGTLNGNVNVSVNEGPNAVIRDGSVYILYSASAGSHVNSSIGYIKAQAGGNLLSANSWTKGSQPIFKGDTSTSTGSAGVYYVRQPCLVKSPDGTEDWLLYQAGTQSYGNANFSGGVGSARPYFNSLKDRSVRMQKVAWDDLGNPDFGTPKSLTAVFAQPSGTDNSNIYAVEAEDAVLTGVQNPSDRTTTSELRKVTGITNCWLRGGNENGSGQGNAQGGWGTYWNASNGLAVRLGQNGAATFNVDVAEAGNYDLTVMGVALEYNAAQLINVNNTEYEMVHTLYSQRYGGLFTPQSVSVALNAGENEIVISNKEGSIGAVIDYIYLSPSTDYVDKAALAELIAEAQGKDGTYTPSSLAVFNEALTAAQAVMADEDATGKEIQNAYDALETAINDLTEYIIYVYSADTDADEYVQGSPTIFTVVTSTDVENVVLVNETGRIICSDVISKTTNGNRVTWKLSGVVGTKGKRTVGIYVSTADMELFDSEVSVDLLVAMAISEGRDGVAVTGVRAPITAVADEAFAISINTTTSATKIGIFDAETGKALGKISQSYTDRDGTRKWTITTKIGTKGLRSFVVKATDASGEWCEGMPIDITVIK